MLTIRRATGADEAAVRELVSRVWDDDYVMYVWADWVADETHLPLVAYAADGALAGLCHVGPQIGGDCWFSAMRVDPNYRRAGVGSALTHAAVAAARDLGYRNAVLGIDRDNVPSLTMTERAGFTRIAEYVTVTFAPVPNFAGPTLRPATAAEIPLLTELGLTSAAAQGTVPAVYWDWEWVGQVSPETVQPMVASGRCAVLADRPITGCLPYWDDDDHAHASHPYGDAATALDLVRGLVAMTSGQGQALHLNVQPSPPLLAALTALGGVVSMNDGWTIWCMPLNPQGK